MKAVILVGGEGTRLRPLTNNRPKPLIPLVNRPFLDHVLHLLKTHGIDDVVLAMSYLSENFEQAYGDGSHLGLRLTYVREEQPMGTGGAIKNVESHLAPGETFLVFNGDVLTDIDLTDMLNLHRGSGSSCTISLTPVDDPSSYGVVDLDDAGRIQRFTEKPKREEATSNWINAGTYVLEPEALGFIPEGQHYMVERGLFPTLLAEGKPLYGYKTGAYWMDIGTPAKYLQAHADLLAERLKYYIQPEGELFASRVWAGEGTVIDEGARLTGPVVVGKNCHIGEGAAISGPVVLGDNCNVAANAELHNIVAWDNVVFGLHSKSRDCLIANDATIGEGCRIEGLSVIGDHATVGSGNHLTDATKVGSSESLPDVR
ncbi:MAG TPA: NDP-sugar synthase [Chloroflexia bacterium]|nr:NDP-sugar synthase [Chloroflexia bacterium]